MKHIFVINPHAGKCDATDSIRQQINDLCLDFDHEIYVTSAPGDATFYVQKYCKENPSKNIRFYACGGDGTINEVVSGIVGQPNTEMTCYPSGSGNDYVKYFGGSTEFLDIRRLVSGTVKQVDVMRVNDRYALNVCNFGFDAIVCKTMIQVRRK